MKWIVVLILTGACAAPTKPSVGEYWYCRAESEFKEKASHFEQHWATCPGNEWCAREAALKKCLWHHPDDCHVVSCVSIPELKGTKPAEAAPITEPKTQEL